MTKSYHVFETETGHSCVTHMPCVQMFVAEVVHDDSSFSAECSLDQCFTKLAIVLRFQSSFAEWDSCTVTKLLVCVKIKWVSQVNMGVLRFLHTSLLLLA